MNHTPSSSDDNPTTLELLAGLICKTAQARFLRVVRTEGHPPQIVFTAANATDVALTFALSVTELSSHEIRKCLENAQRSSQPLEEKQQDAVPEQECEIAAKKPSLMETSPSGALVMTGKGVQTVRERIEQQFEKARNQGATALVPKPDKKPALKTYQMSVMESVAAPATLPRRPLSEIAVPILRVAEERFRDANVRHPHHLGAYLVTPPTETAEELFAAATKVVDAVCPQQKKAERHEMEEQ